MRYKNLQSVEDTFRRTGNNGEYSFRKISLPVPGEDLQLEGLFCTPKGRAEYYYAVEHPKERIVLHYTTGNIRSDISKLTTNKRHVSVPFVIARDGTIYQLFPSKYWSGHLGKGVGNIGSGNAQDKCTIGIELSNYGYLTDRQGNLETYYSRLKNPSGVSNPVDNYCSKTDTDAYQYLATPFKEQSYYATYTQAQYDSLIILLRYLTTQYKIPRNFLTENERFKATEDVLQFKGIVSHVNYRNDGKWDIGPAFDWIQVINGVQADKYVPSYQHSVAPKSINDENAINTEEELEALLPKAKDPSFENEPYEESFIKADTESSSSIENEKDSSKPNLYALLVGINDYDSRISLKDGVHFRPLNGCVSDVRKVQDYLQQDTTLEKHIVLLTNQQASKAEIVRQFKEHLGRAREGDVVFFYFSGHGAPEKADTSVWTSDTDGRLECLACYYDSNTKNNFLLADKEMRYLIYELSISNPHIVTVFDCCHSADNTRALIEKAFGDAIEKTVKYSFPQREWNNFIFSNKLNRDQVLQDGEAVALPEGLHVQLAACEADESAFEVSGEGVFTKALLKVLRQSAGGVTYHTLRSRVRQYLRNIYKQTPRIYVVNGDEGLLYATFLNRRMQDNKSAFADVVYNESEGWLLGLGAIHGIGEKNKIIKIFDPKDITQIYQAEVAFVGADYAKVRLKDSLDKNRVYSAYVEGLLSKILKVNIQNNNGLLEDQKELIEIILRNSNGNILLEDNEEKAQYTIRSNNGKYYITYPNDPFRPLVKPVNIDSTKAPSIVADYLKHINQWEFLKGLINEDPKNGIKKEALKVEFFYVLDDDKEVLLELQNDELFLEYEQKNGKWRRLVKVRLTNTSTHKLYCSALYLSSYFGSYTGFLNPEVYLLEPDNSVELHSDDDPHLSVSLSRVVQLYNWSEQVEYFKFIYSTQEFNVKELSLEDLPKPITSSTDWNVDRDIDRDIDRSVAKGWTTRLITIHKRNPEVNKIRESDLSSLLRDPELSDFALGLYYDGIVDENWRVEYILKSNIQIIGDDGQDLQKGLIQDIGLDLANWWARRRRNILYKKITQRFPERVRIVSEGDSWFQHPLVLDVIDHLSRNYAIYCLAAAGDTLRNYLSREKSNGDYYLDALEEHKPSIFLISGGGNDILGSQFESYLNDNPDLSQLEGSNPKRFLKDSLFKEIDTLMELYRTWFNHLKTFMPDLHVIVHGYDYPVKINDEKKGWLGRYMIKKGISRPGDRKAIISLIMDTFNEKLEQVTSDFDNVSYINVRNTVHYSPKDGVDQWYDEIHPDNNGFQQVAMKFMQQIDKVIQSKATL